MTRFEDELFANLPNAIGQRHRLSLDINEKEAQQKVAFVRCVTGPIETSNTRHGGTIMHIRNPEILSRSLSHSSYVGMTFLAIKVVASWGPGDPSSTRLY